MNFWIHKRVTLNDSWGPGAAHTRTTPPIPDLVVIKIATRVAIPGTVQARQDGSGHGPPH